MEKAPSMKAGLMARAVKDPPVYRWWALFLASTVQAVVVGASWTIMPVLFNEIAQPQPVGLGLSLVELGAIWGILPLAAAFFCIPMGIAGDRFDLRWVIGAGLVLTAVAGALRGVVDDFTSLAAWMFLFGIGLSAIRPNVSKLIGMWFPPEELGMSNGIALGSYGLGAGLAIQFGGTLISPALGGWRDTLWIIGIIIAGIGILWIFTIRSRKADPSMPGVGPDHPAGRKSLFHGMSVALGSRDIRYLAIALVSIQLGYVGLIGYLPIYLEERGLSQASANGNISVLLYLFVAGAIIIPLISDRIGTRKWVFFFSLSINALAAMATAFVSGPALTAAFIVWGFATGGIVIIFVVPLEHPRIGTELAGVATGLITALGFTGGFASPIIGNFIVEKAGGETAIVFWGSCYLAAAFIFLRVRETHPRRAAV